MSFRTSLSRILQSANDCRDKSLAITILRDNASQQLMHLLRMNWDTDLEWHIPYGEVPPYRPFDGHEADGMLFNQMRILYIFQKGLDPAQVNMKQAAREKKFVDLLESISADDAKALWAVRNRTLEAIYPFLTHDVVEAAFPGLLPPKGRFKEFQKHNRDPIASKKKEELVRLQETFLQQERAQLPLLDSGQTILEQPGTITHVEDNDQIEQTLLNILGVSGLHEKVVKRQDSLLDNPPPIEDDEDEDDEVVPTKAKPKPNLSQKAKSPKLRSSPKRSQPIKKQLRKPNT